MAYEKGSATDLGDLLSKLDVFMVANGWTQDQFDNGVTNVAQGIVAWHKGDIYVSAKWVANNPDTMSLHQALGFINTSTLPGNHTDDSGNGYNAAFGTEFTLDDERCVNGIGDGPFVSYHFFESDSNPTYVHVVVEIDSETFRHFGWGELEKFNDWTGGEYCYGHFADESTNSSGVDTGGYTPFEGIINSTNINSRRATTIHAEGLPNQLAGEKWLMHLGGVTSDGDPDYQDTAGKDKRITFGGHRGGPIAYALAPFRSDVATGHIPMYPWVIFLRDFQNNFVYPLGNVPDIRGVDIFNFAPGQEVTVGSDVWIMFPQVRRTEDNVVGRTYYAGIAYRKVTT